MRVLWLATVAALMRCYRAPAQFSANMKLNNCVTLCFCFVELSLSSYYVTEGLTVTLLGFEFPGAVNDHQ
jgi:hypothetical protein